MEKILIILRIILLIIIIAILVGILALFINKDLNFNFESNEKLIYDEIINEKFNKIDIDSESLDFEFIKSDDNNVKVRIYDIDNNNVKVNVENNILKIESNKRVKCIFCFYKKRKAIISLPEKIYDLNMKNRSGDIVSNIDFNKVNIVSTSGDIEFNNINVMFIKSTSGDIKINEVNDLKIESTSGDVEIDKINEHLAIETKSGDITIKDLKLKTNSNIKVTSGDIEIENASKDIYYDTHVVSGDIKINNNNRYANVELMINTTSGDITVEN